MFSRGYHTVLVEKVTCEIRKSPSMMWKRSIVQETNRCARSAMALALACLVFAGTWQGGRGADLVIEIPGAGAGAGAGAGGGAEPEAEAEAGGRYRLDYRPPHGSPAPNYTVPARASTINFQGLPGTKYHFMLYYSNATFADLLTWNQTIITAPEPPTNLTVTLGRNKQATIAWSPPVHGDYTGFRFKVIPLSERAEGGAQNISVEGAGNWTHTLADLAPGATYQLHAFTLLHDKESAAYASRNFTTRPNTPGKFIVWFRNETTLLVLWQPPYPPGAYTHYKVSIVPPDAQESEQYVEKEGEPPGPAQAAFKGLVPGRPYNISVQTVSEQEISAPTTAQYRTVPLRPRNVTVRARETAATVRWLPPADDSEFERYQISVSAAAGAGPGGPGGGGGGGGGGRRPAPQLRPRGEPPECSFEGLEPGAHYTAVVKTMSGKVTSWPATVDFTLKPLPVHDLAAEHVGDTVRLKWTPAPGSVQDEYKVSYQEAGPARDDSSSLTTPAHTLTLEALLPGRNYTITVAAVSRGAESNESWVSVATRPLAPVLLAATPLARALTLAWHSDVNSRQERYLLRYRRRRPPPADDYLTLETKDTNVTLKNLYPGAVYEIQVQAVSHGLYSERHTVLKPVRPLPPQSLRVARVSSTSAEVEWAGPGEGAVGRFVLQVRAGERAPWTAPALDGAPRYLLADMTPGERYELRLDSASDDAAGDVALSGHPLHAYHTVRPNPVSNVAQLADTRNMTLEWPRAGGRVDWYELSWQPLLQPGACPEPAAEPRPQPGASPEPSAEPRRLRLQPAAPPARLERALLDGLQPGLGYNVSIAAHSYNLTSEVFTMETRTRPLIQSEMTIVNESDGDADADNETLSTILKVVYTRTPAAASQFDSYRWRLEAGEPGEGAGAGQGAEPSRVEERAAGAEGQQVVFRGLVPGRLYNLTMWTVSCNVTSHPVQRQARLYPRPIRQLNATSVGAHEVTLAWDEPAGVYTDFEVQYLAAADQLQTHYTTQRTITITGLQPHTLYTFTVVVRAGARGSLQAPSRAHSGAAWTREAPPAAPRSLRVLRAAPRALHLAWLLPPAAARGALTHFVLRYEPAPPSPAAAAPAAPAAPVELRLPADAREAAVEGLRPGERYRFSLWAVNGAGAGEPATLEQTTAILAPPAPGARALPAEVRRGSTAVAVRFRADYFSAANGNLTAYTLVLAEEPRNHTPPPLPSWRDVHRLPVWPPYQVTEPYYPFESSAVEEFTIGSERCDPPGRTYCNGPLKPGTRYYVKLRAFTAPDKYTDTAYAVLYTEADSTAWVAGACGAALAALVGAGAVLALRRRRPRSPPAAAPPAPRAARPVRVADFLDHYRLMSADSDFRFSEEFEELKHVGREQPCTAADLPCNRPKNRFTNILPYDHSRYKLQPVDDEEGSDYINANYVPGHNSPREFIVTQGPLHCTRDDFWRMCWESGSRAIVMLTRCVEKGREKCDRYWPYDTRPVYYGDIAVTALNESRYPDWTVSELMLSRGAEQRVLKHFHFTTWPDFGVPDPPTTLARFVRAFRERCPADGRPVVVHCSAGVGRSGTFITLDRALQQLAAHAEYLDIFGMVHAMRRERVWMVQTEQQYICIHQCLVAVLEGQDLAPPPHHNHHNHHLNPAFEDDEGIAESGM